MFVRPKSASESMMRTVSKTNHYQRDVVSQGFALVERSMAYWPNAHGQVVLGDVKAVGTHEGHYAHEDVTDDPYGRHRDRPKHGIGAVIDHTTIPVFVDAARRVAVFAIVLAKS